MFRVFVVPDGKQQKELEKARAQERELAHREIALLRRTLGWVQESEGSQRARRGESSPRSVADNEKLEEPPTEFLGKDEEEPFEAESDT